MDKEQNAISMVGQPNTRASLRQAFSAIGIQPGETLLVHSSLSRIGWVSGGPVAVALALMDALTPAGTLVMPAHSGDLSDPAIWQAPPVPEAWWQTIRESMPGFDPRYTPTRGMGKIVEVFRTMPGVMRSSHPSVSFVAWGKNAEVITADHALEISLGERSPLARVYDLGGRVLLLGVGFGNNTSFHMAEVRSGKLQVARQGAPLLVGGRDRWVDYDDGKYDDSDFDRIGADYLQTGRVTSGKAGAADCLLFDQRDAVNFAVDWMKKERV